MQAMKQKYEISNRAKKDLMEIWRYTVENGLLNRQTGIFREYLMLVRK